jgi:3-oxoacyl-[acyl-carrier-protein] synthase II
MGAAGVLELAGNLGSFEDGLIHPTINVEELDPDCHLENLVLDNPLKRENIATILNNSFGMVGINSTVIVQRLPD